jgi:hypothetical protein
MKSKLTLSVAIFFSVFQLEAGVALSGKTVNYYDYSQSEKQLVFADEFDNEDNNWNNGCSSTGSAWVSVGSLTFKSTSETDAAGCVRSLFVLDQRQDFEIETKLRYYSGSDNKAISLVFGKRTGEWSRFNLGISGNGYYRIDKSYDNNYTDQVDWTESSLVVKNDWNVLTVRKVGSSMYYYINYELVYTTDFEQFYGDEVGFQVPEGTTIWVDYLHAYYLYKTASSATDYYSYNNSQKESFFFDEFNYDIYDWKSEIAGEGTSSIYNGYMDLKATSADGAIGCVRDFPDFNPNRDFELETSIKYLSGDNNSGLYFVFGKDKYKWSRYNLLFTETGYYQISKSYDNEYTTLQDWQQAYVVPGTYNKLTVRKVSNSLYYYVNEQLVYTMDFPGFYGNGIGFQVPQATEISIDYLRISYLNGSSSASQQQASAYQQKDVQGPEITLYEPSVGKEQSISVNDKQIVVRGKVTDNGGIYEVVINGTDAAIDNSGTFQQAVKLAIGSNTISIRATDTDNNSTIYTFYAKREGATLTNIQTISDNSQQTQQAQATVTINEKRIALIIGNSNYAGGMSLKNPANDASLMAQSLRALGFEVISRTDATKKSMESAIREFSEKLPNYNVALFYYAGHGMQVDGMNYLIPTDAELSKKEDCKWEAIAVNFVVEEFEKYPDNTNIVILDACRSDPFRSFSRGGERGFKAIAPTSGTIIAFATSEGSTAADGSGANGLFTQELVKQLQVPQAIETVFKKTRVEVERISGGAQSPQEWSKLKGDFWFKR